MTIDQGARLCGKYGLETAKSILAKTPAQAVSMAKKLSYPVVAKIDSPDIVHKTDAGAVVAGIRNEKELERACREISENAKKYSKKAKILGYYVQEMVKGTEFIVGAKKDQQFGHVLLFGVGGTMTELYKDYALRICPITRKDALEMIEEITAKKVIEGYRNSKPVDKESLAAFLEKAAGMVEKENIKELDLNPVIASGSRIIAADARIIK